ncbi:hypothetical protein ABID47_001470 [Paenibacillus favisporus]|uniref:Uncharacterized protein n=1 Tax=Paenibacillus favisporus TaxID=221028 RepID=A0ABV2EZE6_9BACL
MGDIKPQEAEMTIFIRYARRKIPIRLFSGAFFMGGLASFLKYFDENDQIIEQDDIAHDLLSNQILS